MVTRIVDKNDTRASFIHRWIEEISKHVDTLYVIALEVHEHSLPENVIVFSMGKEKTSFRPMYVINYYLNSLKIIGKVDAIFCHMNQVYTYMSWPYKLLLGKRIVSWYTHVYYKMPLRLVNFMCDILVSASERTCKIKSKKKKIIGHGIDTAVFEPMHLVRSRAILYTGRINRIKGCKQLLHAVKGEKQFKVVFVGVVVYEDDRKYLEEMKNYALDNDIDMEVKNGVPFKQIARIYNSYTYFVNLSPKDALDKTNLESMACGTFTFTKSENIKELMGDLSKYFIYDSPKELIEKIKLVERLPENEKIKIKKLLRDLILEHHNLEKLAKRIVHYCGDNK